MLDKQRLWAVLGELPGKKNFHLFTVSTKKQQGVKYNHCHKHEKDGTPGKALGNQYKTYFQSDASYIIRYFSEKIHEKKIKCPSFVSVISSWEENFSLHLINGHAKKKNNILNRL